MIPSRPLFALCFVAAFAAAFAIYLPGIDGPFLFDDFPNIIANRWLAIDGLSLGALRDAAFSQGPDTPKRGLSLVSFALNHHFAGGGFYPRAFKLTNVAIHLVNGLLIFALARALLGRLAARGEWLRPGAVEWVALLAAALWLLHPLQLTSVLYVVQRMTSLAALFVFAGLLAYAAGRARVARGAPGGFWLMAAGIAGGTALGVMNKENAVLLPFLAFVTGRVFFDDDALPEATRRALGRFHLVFVGLPLLAGIAGIAWIWQSNLNIYDNVREFTLGERLLTQPRVLFLYVGLFLLPHLRGFSLHHDDLVTSTGLLTPPTTLLAIAALAALVVIGLVGLHRRRLYGFAIAFFLVGHGIESSFISLEMVHEHRNYVPSFALALTVACALAWCAARTTRGAAIAGIVSVAMLAATGTVTASRAGIWSSVSSLGRYLVEQNPDSYRSLALLARAYAVENRSVDELLSVYGRIATVNPKAIFPVIRMRRVVRAMEFQVDVGLIVPAAPAPDGAVEAATWKPQTLYLDPRYLEAVAAALDDEIVRRLSEGPVTVEAVAEFDAVRECVRDQEDMCVGLVGDVERWIDAAVHSRRVDDWALSNLSAFRGEFAAFRKDYGAALDHAREAERLSPKNDYFRLHQVLYLGRLGRLDDARRLLEQVRVKHGEKGAMADEIDTVANLLDTMPAQPLDGAASPG